MRIKVLKFSDNLAAKQHTISNDGGERRTSGSCELGARLAWEQNRER